MKESLLTDMDILLNDIIFEEVQSAAPTDTDIDIYNRVAEIWNIPNLDCCAKALNLIHKNQNICKCLKELT